MKQLVIIAALLFFCNLAACNTGDEEPVLPEITGNPETPSEENEVNAGDNQQNEENLKLIIWVGEVKFFATLKDNVTTEPFKRMLPLRVIMNDLNKVEKYFYLPENLPVSAYNPGTIHNGDLMLYGSNCLVLFYKTISSGYSYTRLGTVDNPSGLQNALGAGSVEVTFEIKVND